jgi:uncharacterized protein YkwD
MEHPSGMRISGAVALAGLMAMLGCAAKPQQPQPKQPGTAPEVIRLINEKRADAGCPAVAPDDRLATAAGRQAADMRDHGVQDHTGSDASSPQQRIEAAGFSPATATGEILLWGTGSTSPQQAVDAWMASPPHREVIEQCAFTHAGVVVLQADSRYFAVVAFARR